MDISPFRQNKFLVFFRYLDIDGDGAITSADFSRYLDWMQTANNWGPDAEQLAPLKAATDQWWRALQEQADANDDGLITSAEFVGFFAELGAQIARTGAVPAWAMQLCVGMHRLLDLDGDGTVCAQEYALWLTALSVDVDPVEAFARIDVSGNGVITLPELVVLFSQFVLSDDPADPGNYLMTGGI